MEHDINNRNETSQSTGTPKNKPPNLVNFDPETAENGWRVLAHPLNFRIGRHCQPYRMVVILQTAGKLWHVLAHVVGQAYSLEQQNARRVHAELYFEYYNYLSNKTPMSTMAIELKRCLC